MDTFIVTDASVEELTESYGDVGDFGVSTFVSNNSYDIYTYRSMLGRPNGIMAMMYNCCNVIVYYLILYLLMLIKIRYFWLCMLLMLLESHVDVIEVLNVVVTDSVYEFFIHTVNYICYLVLYFIFYVPNMEILISDFGI